MYVTHRQYLVARSLRTARRYDLSAESAIGMVLYMIERGVRSGIKPAGGFHDEVYRYWCRSKRWAQVRIMAEVHRNL